MSVSALCVWNQKRRTSLPRSMPIFWEWLAADCPAVAFTVEHFIETSRIILSGELKDEAETARVVETLRRDIRTGAMLA